MEVRIFLRDLEPSEWDWGVYNSNGKLMMWGGRGFTKRSDALRAIRRIALGLQNAIVVEEVSGKKIKKALLSQKQRGNNNDQP